jgi:dCMP deaminase
MSPDHNTKHGSCIVDQHKRIISVGFNGFPPDCNDEDMPRTRPDKYLVSEHSECNALNNALGDVEGMTLYVTGHPCAHCFRTILCRRIAKVIYDPTIESACITDQDLKMIELMNRKKVDDLTKIAIGLGRPKQYKVQLIPFEGNFAACMDRAKEYYRIKQELKAKK